VKKNYWKKPVPRARRTSGGNYNAKIKSGGSRAGGADRRARTQPRRRILLFEGHETLHLIAPPRRGDLLMFSRGTGERPDWGIEQPLGNEGLALCVRSGKKFRLRGNRNGCL